VGLTRRTPLVAYGYSHPVVAVVQFAHHLAARRVHDRVGDQLGDDQLRHVAGVLTDGPPRKPGAGKAPGLLWGTRMRGQLETKPALGSRIGGAETVLAPGGVCS
jgi:hypothetical protein